MESCFDPRLTEREVGEMTALGLAHMGDAVYELLVRSWLCAHGGVRADDLHRRTVSFVRAGAQAEYAEKLLPLLTEQEEAWYRRGRNAHAHHDAPKGATEAEYAKATGLECLFGALFLTGRRARAEELFLKMLEDDHGV